MESHRKYQRFFAELKRRRVFRVVAVYGIVAFVVLQVVDLAVPALLLPDWTLRLIALFLLAGFPVAVVLAWAFEQTPEGWKRTDPAAPGEIDAIVSEPASRRWPSGLLALLGIIALLFGAAWVGRQTVRPIGDGNDVTGNSGLPRLAMGSAPRDDRPTIGVLPFADMSPAGDQEYFSDGITEELLNTLAKISDLKVMARTSAFAFKGENLDMRAVGDSLGARYLVEGSVRKASDQLRITAQLIDAEDGSHLWSESYDRRLENVFEIQSEIARAIADELRVPLGLDEGQSLVAATEDLKAFDLYLAGRARIRERGESVFEAIELFEAAIAQDSTWAPAWAGLAESWSFVPYYAPTPSDSTVWARSLAQAERAARRAIELDPDNASALVALGNVHRDRREWDEAENTYLHALTLDPENVEAYQQYSYLLFKIGRADEAYAASHRSLALDRVPIRLNVAGLAATANLRCEEAITLFSEGIRKDADERVPHLRSNLARLHLLCGRWREVRERKLRNLAELDRDAIEDIRERWNKPHLREIAGGRQWADEVRRMWPNPEAPSPEVVDFAFWSLLEAILWGHLDMPEKALPILEELMAQRGPYRTTSWLFYPAFDALRDDPAFQDLLAAAGLEGRRPARLGPVEEEERE